MGAIGEDGVLVVEGDTVDWSGVSDEEFERVVAEERAELDRRVRLYRQGRPLINLKNRTVVIVDDGLATGATALAACEVVRARGAARVIVAAPVTSATAANRMNQVADQFVSPVSTCGPFAVGQWYEEFGQVSDQEVIDDLTNARSALADASRTLGAPAGT